MHPIDGFDTLDFSWGGASRVVYTRGEGPPIVLMHEMPGMVPECIDLAKKLADQGFSIFMPLLFGKPGENAPLKYALKMCVSREVYLFAKGIESPICEWLRALCRHVSAQADGQGVGVIGMCLTGGFALGLMTDPSVIAPVMSQPSLPVDFRAATRGGLGLPDEALEKIQRRVEDEDRKVMAMRFTCDPFCTEERFARLRALLGDRFIGVEIDSSKGNPHGFKRLAHAVLTVDHKSSADSPTQLAYEQMVQFFKQQLG